MTTEGTMFGPVRKSVRVHLTTEEAFRLFTEHIDRWWPVEVFSRAADEQYGDGVKVERVVFCSGGGDSTPSPLRTSRGHRDAAKAALALPTSARAGCARACV